jgi:hypothetical protein
MRLLAALSLAAGLACAGDEQTAPIGPASQLEIVSGNGQSALPGQQLPAPLRVRATDEDGLRVPWTTIDFVLPDTAGTLSVKRTTTDARGEAWTRWTLPAALGAYEMLARLPGADSVRFTASATVAAPSRDRV